MGAKRDRLQVAVIWDAINEGGDGAFKRAYLTAIERLTPNIEKHTERKRTAIRRAYVARFYVYYSVRSVRMQPVQASAGRVR